MRAPGHERVVPIAAVERVWVCKGHGSHRSLHEFDVGTDHSPIVRCEIRSDRAMCSGGVLHGMHGTLRPVTSAADKLPIKMLSDRLLVRVGRDDGERRSTGGILIPATAQMAKRLVWVQVVALGPSVRSAEVDDRVLFSPEDRFEVEVQGEDLIMLRERDIHAVAAERIEASTGLYL